MSILYTYSWSCFYPYFIPFYLKEDWQGERGHVVAHLASVILIKSWVSLRPYDEKKTRLFINITCFQKLALRFFWAIIEEKHFFGLFVLLKFSVQEKKAQIFGKFPHIQAKIFQDCIFCITNCMNFHTHVIV